MSLALTQSSTALAAKVPASFLATGGTAPYAYSVLPGGAGGTIDPSTGAYVAPSAASSDPKLAYDTIQVIDSALVPATATAQILVGSPLLLFCEILQKELNLNPGRVYLWDQKIFQPTDSGLYIAVSVPSCKPFGSVLEMDSSGSGLEAIQWVSMLATLDLDIISRGPEARDRKEEVILAFNSVYSQQQQEANSFYIAKLPPGSRFLNLSEVDGAAIPYRYKISVNLQYAFTKNKPAEYFNTFQDIPVTVNP